ncbi:MAG: methyltransferase domain-containing protein [Candidatus Pacebacteria bacterium]|nr:methyltransferase domain-containing protein [Candidatus Paceibacterota bacterium]
MKVDNFLLSSLYNKLDFPIRFIYSHSPFLNKLLFWKLYSSDFEKLDSQFENMKLIVKNNGFDFNNKICLELGPGNSYINAYNLLMNGAKKVFLIDKFSRRIKTKKQKDFFKKEVEFIKKKYKEEKLFFIKENSINSQYIEFIEGDIRNLNLNSKVDFVLTKSVLEHIKNIKQTITKLSEITKNNGFNYHYIDLRDHYNFSSPFLFYKYSPETWNKALTREGRTYTNRLRYDQYLDIFKENNFNVVYQQLERFTVLNNQKIFKEFNKHKEFLDIGIAKVLLKKND